MTNLFAPDFIYYFYPYSFYADYNFAVNIFFKSLK